jgi:probable rRNA maturation factor
MTGRRPRLSLSVQYAARGDDLPARVLLRRWARAALAHDAAITVRFVDEAEGRALNRSYRHRDHATNVLAFVYHDVHGAHGVDGDIVLCAPVMRREATEQGKSMAAHCAHLFVHGLLHLQGYDHEQAPGAARMEAREVVILAGLGFPDPYAARTPARRIPS